MQNGFPKSLVWYLVQRSSPTSRSFCSKRVDVISGVDITIPTHRPCRSWDKPSGSASLQKSW